MASSTLITQENADVSTAPFWIFGAAVETGLIVRDHEQFLDAGIPLVVRYVFVHKFQFLYNKF